MALAFVININSGGPGGATLAPATQNVDVGDVITWANNDSEPHWPAITATPTGPVTDRSGLMPNEIQPDDSSDEFRPGPVPQGATSYTLYYACVVHPKASSERGEIVVSEAGA